MFTHSLLAFHKIVRFPARSLIGRQLTSINGAQSIVYVGNLPLDYSLDRFNSFAASMGIKGHTGRLVMQKEKFRGFGYLDFSTPEEANDAVEKLNDAEVDGRKLKIDLDAGRDGPNKGRRPSLFTDEHSIFIGNLPFSMNRADVQHMVEDEVGKVMMKVRLAVADNMRSKGYCHVDFTNKEDVEAAISKLSQFSIRGRELTVAQSVPRIRHNEDESEDPDDGIRRFVPRSTGRPRRSRDSRFGGVGEEEKRSRFDSGGGRGESRFSRFSRDRGDGNYGREESRPRNTRRSRNEDY